MNDQGNKSSTDFRLRLNEASNQLRLGSLYLWNRTQLADALSEMPEVWNMSPAFWILTLNSLRDESILYLTRLVECRNDSLNLSTIRKWIEKHEGCIPKLTPQQVRKDVLPKFKGEISDVQQEVIKIVKVRDEEIAHLNLEMLQKPKEAVSGVTYSEIERVYKRVHGMLDRLSEDCLGDGIEMLEVLGSGDFRAVLECAQTGLESKQERLKSRVS